MDSFIAPTNEQLHPDGDPPVPRPGDEPEEASVYGGLEGVFLGSLVVRVALEHLVPTHKKSVNRTLANTRKHSRLANLLSCK